MPDAARAAEALVESIVEDNRRIYRRLFSTTARAGVRDPRWTAALALFDRLSSDQQQVFFRVLRQVTVDSVSNVLGVLDGSSTLNGLGAEFSVTCGGSVQLSGSLQDSFLAALQRQANS